MLSTLDDALIAVNTSRASLGAVVNQLTSAADNLTNVSQNLSESRSRVLDTDYAAATTELARTQIIQQAGMAVLAQANQQPQTVLALLR
jgi:flagellin